VLYPLMQGYDSVALNADVELGGSDQRFNLLAGRALQRRYGQEPQDIVTSSLLEGTDGRKMSSSWGNVINVADEPGDMFGKVMSVRDELIIRYFELCTDVTLSEIADIKRGLESGVNPRDAKIRLATEIVALYHGADAAKKAHESFLTAFTKGGIPDDAPTVVIASGTPLIEALLSANVVASKTEARRLFEAGAIKRVDADEIKMTDPEGSVTESMALRVGKHRFVRFEV
jgi:tyrosyl-tRNA synthetase